MTKLVVEELYSSLEQNFNAKSKTTISSIRPWIYKHLSPVGDFNLVIIQNSQTIATSNTVTSAYIEANSGATSSNYTHGFFRFDFAAPFIINRGDFTLRLTSSGYTFSDSAYLGWVKPHENINIDQDYVPTRDNENTFGVQFFKYKDRL